MMTFSSDMSYNTCTTDYIEFQPVEQFKKTPTKAP